MRVLFVVRPHLYEHRGGDTTQILSTARELRARGVKVDLRSCVPGSLAPWDLVHLFHLDRLWENLGSARAVSGRLPMVISTIWWPKGAYNAHSRQGVQGFLARSVGTQAFDSLRVIQRSAMAFAERPAAATIPRPEAWRFLPAARKLLRAAALVLPNSEAEQRALESYFGLEVPYRVVHNGVNPDAELVVDGSGTVKSADVLCVGQFTPRKNQHKVIEALEGTDVNVAFAGTAGQFSRRYETACHRGAGPNVRFLGPVPHERMPGLYRSARVHVLPSWFETPGLSSLEAAAYGCPIVVGDSPPVREYFGDLATYCDPGSTASIRDAVLSARQRPADPRLAAMVSERYTWSAAAAATLEAYEEALRLARPRC